eukprot:615072-Pelagomonas_calceolata.AAC.3
MQQSKYGIFYECTHLGHMSDEARVTLARIASQRCTLYELPYFPGVPVYKRLGVYALQQKARKHTTHIFRGAS